MYETIFMVAIIVIFALSLLFGLLVGKRHIPSYAVLKLCSTVIAAVGAMLIAVFTTKLLLGLVITPVLKLPFLSGISEIIATLPTSVDALTALLAMLIAPMFMVTVFFVLKWIMNLVIRIIIKSSEARKQKDVEEKRPRRRLLKRDKATAAGMICGALCGLLICTVLTIPVLGTLSFANTTLGIVNEYVSIPVLRTAGDIVSDAVDNKASRVIKNYGGDFCYDLLTTQKMGDQTTTLSKEVSVVTSTLGAVKCATDPNVSKEATSSAILAVDTSFSQSAIVPTILNEVATVAGQSWDKGEAFLGIQKPTSENADINAILDIAIDHVTKSDVAEFKKDAGTVIHILAIVIKDESVKNVTDDPMQVLRNEELASAIIYEILANNHMATLIEDVSDYGVHYLCGSLELELDNFSINMTHITDTEKESKALAGALGMLFGLLDEFEGVESADESLIRDVGPVLDAFLATEMVGPANTSKLLTGLLSSDVFCSGLGYSQTEAKELANSINATAEVEGYTPLMNSLCQLIEVVRISSSSSTDVNEMSGMVETLLSDLTPSTAKVIENTISPSMMSQHGVPEGSATEVSGMVSNIFGNLASAKENGMTDEEYKKEAAATTNVINIAMNASKADSGEVFGENGAIGKSAEETIDDIFESTVITQTIVDSVYKEDSEEPVVNPLNLEKDLGEEEKQTLVETLNNKWESASEEEKASEDYQKQFIAIGALFNVQIEITDSGITA